MLGTLEPGYDRNTVSGMVSRWHRVFCALGYPELDLREYADGEKAIIQYFNAPIVPSLTKWQAVLCGLRNVEISPSYLKYWAEKLDLNRAAVWDDVASKEKEHMRQLREDERRAEDFATRATDAVKRNPELMERIAKNGLREANPRRILNNIPKWKLGKHGKHLQER